MKRIPFLLLGLLMAVACTETTTEPEPLDLAVSFGTLPSPFFPSATYAMEAVVQHLEVIGGGLESLCHPPSPCQPDPALIGKLGAMTNELGMINEQVVALLGFPPDPITPPDQVAALASAAGEAYLAAGSIRLGTPPDDIVPEVRDAFGAVTDAAGVIQNTIAGSPFCSSAAEGNRCVETLPA